MIKYNLAWVISCLFVLTVFLAWLADRCGIAPRAAGLSRISLRLLWIGVTLLPASIVWLLIAIVAFPRYTEYYLIIVSLLPFFTSFLMGAVLSFIWVLDQIWKDSERAENDGDG